MGRDRVGTARDAMGREDGTGWDAMGMRKGRAGWDRMGSDGGRAATTCDMAWDTRGIGALDLGNKASAPSDSLRPWLTDPAELLGVRHNAQERQEATWHHRTLLYGPYVVCRRVKSGGGMWVAEKERVIR